MSQEAAAPFGGVVAPPDVVRSSIRGGASFGVTNTASVGAAGPLQAGRWPDDFDEMDMSDEADEVDEAEPTWQTVKASHPLREKAGKSRRVDVALPTNWASQLAEDSLTWVASDWDAEIYQGCLACNPNTRVSVWVMKGGTLVRTREAKIMRRLTALHGLDSGLSGHVLNFWDRATIGRTSFALLEAEDQTMDLLFEDLEASTSARSPEENEAWSRRMTLAESLPVIADVLRGAIQLEKAGVVHGALLPENILLKDGRAIVGGLEAACLVHDGQEELCCSSLCDDEDLWYLTSPFWQPPEITDGAPTGPLAHTWAVGMLLATMTLGYQPAYDFAIRLDPMAFAAVDRVDLREDIRTLLSEQFSIEGDLNYQKVDDDTTELIDGMLHFRPEFRWTTEEALSAVLETAEDLGIEVPREMMASAPPPCWRPSKRMKNLQRWSSGWLEDSWQ